MKIILDVSSSDPNFSGNCDFAILNLTTALAEKLLMYSNIHRALRDQIFAEIPDPNHLSDLKFYAYNVDFYSWDTLEQAGLNPDGLERYDVIPDDFDGEPERTEDDVLFVCDTFAYWESIIKHTNVSIETCGVTMSLLRHFLDFGELPEDPEAATTEPEYDDPHFDSSSGEGPPTVDNDPLDLDGLII